MKKFLFISCMALLLAGCNNNGETATKTSFDTTTTAKMSDNKSGNYDYPYTLSRPYQNWQPGDQQHVVTVLKSLKAYETNDVAGSMAAFADTVEVQFDYYHAKLSKDSLKKVFTEDRAKYSSIVIKMSDWESVISSDKKEEWVTLWYKQITTDTKGKTDSLNCVDDAKIVNGKIALLDGKIQHFPAPKK